MNKGHVFTKKVTAKKVTAFDIGDTIAVSQRIKEGKKDRLQVFEGIVIAKKHGSEPGATFTMRKIASGVGVEKVFPLYSPLLEKIRVVKKAKVRRAKLYYLRTAKGKRGKLKKKDLNLAAAVVTEPKEPAEEPATEQASGTTSIETTKDDN